MAEQQDTTPAELCELLPWFVNGSLDEAETALIEEHLQQCRECRDELPILQAIPGAVQRASVAVLTPKVTTGDFLAGTGAKFRQPKRRQTLWIAAGVAASLLVAVLIVGEMWQGGAIVAGHDFETVTGTGNNSSFDYVVRIAFEPGADANSRQLVLDALHPESVSGPDTKGAYRVVVRLPARSVEELHQYTRSIETNSSISSATVIAIELPVEDR